MRFLLISLITGIMPLTLVNNAFADRFPTSAELRQIEAKLASLGFTAWDSIEFDEDDGYWEVDDARGADGMRFDLHLATRSLELLRRERD
jgi:hypothetical protein